MKKKMLLMLLAVAVSVSMIAAATYAWFTDEDDAGKATFTAGTLSVDVSGLKEFYDEEIELLTTIDHMNPGDEFGPIEIIIENTGNKKLMWLGDLEFELKNLNKNDNLLDAMYISYAKMEHLNEDDTDWLEAAEFITNDGTEAGSLSFLLDSPAILDDENGEKITPVMTLRGFNDHTQNGGPGEFAGALIPGCKYKLTLKFALHKRAGNDCQGNVASPIKIGFNVSAYQHNADYYEELRPTLGISHTMYNFCEGLFAKQINASLSE